MAAQSTTALPTHVPTQIAVLVEGALAAGVHEARPIVDADGSPATLIQAGKVVLLRVIGLDQIGTDRIDAFLLDDEVQLTFAERCSSFMSEAGSHRNLWFIIAR
jgi:hypothetical protein